jgi:hypothetical protein
MALLGDIEAVKSMLRPTDSAEFSTDADARLALLQSAVTLLFDQKIGRSFGGTATPTARTFDAGLDCSDPTLFLPEPARSISAVAIVGTNPQTLTLYDPTTKLGDYLPWHVTREGDILAIRIVQNAYWPARTGYDRITVTAVWSDTDNGGGIPDDLNYAANYVISEVFKAEQASPAGFTGPDGATVPVRDPWKNPMVVGTIAKYGGARRIVSF